MRQPPERAAPAGRRRAPDPSDYPFVRAVGRLPANVHTKLLIAFVGTAVLVVAVGLLGLRVLGQSNDRAARLGVLQERALAYGKLESDTRNVRLLLNENPGPDFYAVNPAIIPIGRDTTEVAIDQAVRNALVRLRSSTRVDRLGFVPPAEDRLVLREIRAKSERLSIVIVRIIESSIGGASDEEQKPLRNKAHRLATDLYQTAAGPRDRDDGCNRGCDRAERELVLEPAQPLRRRGHGRDRPRAAARVRPLLVGHRADPANRLPAGCDRLGRFLGSRRRQQPRRARRTRRERQPHERRARPPVPGARDRESAQIGVPREHVSRATYAAERDHRLLAGAPRGHLRGAQREAGGVPQATSSPRATTSSRSSTTCSISPRWRRGRSSSASRSSRSWTRSRAVS